MNFNSALVRTRTDRTNAIVGTRTDRTKAIVGTRTDRSRIKSPRDRHYACGPPCPSLRVLCRKGTPTPASYAHQPSGCCHAGTGHPRAPRTRRILAIGPPSRHRAPSPAPGQRHPAGALLHPPQAGSTPQPHRGWRSAHLVTSRNALRPSGSERQPARWAMPMPPLFLPLPRSNASPRDTQP